MKRLVSILALAALLSACGGGGGGSTAAIPIVPTSQAPVVTPVTETPTAAPEKTPTGCTISLWGDSILHGGYSITERLAEPPAVALKRLRPDWTIEDRSVNGASATYTLPTILQDKLESRVQLFEYGVNDAALGLAYEASMRSIIERAISLKKTVVITGLSRPEGDNSSLDDANAVAEKLAAEYKVAFANWRSVPFEAGDTADGLHPKQAYSLRLVARIAETLDVVAPECSAGR